MSEDSENEAQSETEAEAEVEPKADAPEADAEADGETATETPETEPPNDSVSEPATKPSSDESATAESAPRWKRWALPGLIYVICTAVYLITLGPRIGETSPDNHYSHLANSWLEGQLHHVGNPPGHNDWACYDHREQDMCPNNRWSFPDRERFRWYVSFPPLPAAVILPAVAAFGVDVPDRLFWALIAGFGPAFLFILLRRLRETGRIRRTRFENLLLTALFAFGTVYFFVAVQGTVWFAAQVVATPLLILYLYFGLDARRPILAGLMLGLCFLTRPTTALLFVFFAFEILRTARKKPLLEDREGDGPYRTADGGEPDEVDDDIAWWNRFRPWFRDVDWKKAIKIGALFAAPILVCGIVAMWMNDARFDDPFEFGHTYLQIRWRPRIERWGLFNYHYFSKNLAVFAASTPWLSQESPYLMISRHGLALWVTTPALFWILWPKKTTPTMWALWVGIIPVALVNLCYQNSGWAQFGYRFALDYLPLVFILLAMGNRRFRVGFYLLFIWAVAINTFGAITFDRAQQFYDQDSTQERLFQPDRVP